MLCAVAPVAALPYHHRATVAAEQLIGQQILSLRPYPRRGAAVYFEHFLHFVECGVVNQCRHTALIADVVEDVHAGVLLIFQQAVQAVDGELAAARRSDPLRVEPCNDFRDGFAVGVPLENLCHKRGGFGVNLISFCVGIDIVPDNLAAAHGLGFLGTLALASAHILRQLKRVVFCHAFKHGIQNNALRAVWHVLCDALHPDPVLFATVTVKGYLLTVTPESVNLP